MRGELFESTVDFIKTRFPAGEVIPLHAPVFDGNEKKYLIDVIDSTYVSSVGRYVDKFEEMLADFCHVPRSVATVNGTAALQIALKLAGVKPGEEVLTQALTFVATANAIIYNGAIPVFIDVDQDTLGLSPQAMEAFLEEFGEIRDDGCYNKHSGKRLAACVPMHTFGFPVHMDELLSVCKKWHLPVVEDAAESLGSEYKGRQTGSLGDIGIFSFNGNKIVTCGGGGAIVTKDKSLADKAKYLTTTAKVPHAYEFYHSETGFNFRMPNLNAALACAQMEQLNKFIADKRDLALEYAAFFESKGVKFRTELPGTKANYWLMSLELNNKEEREVFLKLTNSRQVMTRPIWQLMFRLPMFEHCQRDEQKNAIFLEERIVNIPSSFRATN